MPLEHTVPETRLQQSRLLEQAPWLSCRQRGGRGTQIPAVHDVPLVPEQQSVLSLHPVLKFGTQTAEETEELDEDVAEEVKLVATLVMDDTDADEDVAENCELSEGFDVSDDLELSKDDGLWEDLEASDEELPKDVEIDEYTELSEDLELVKKIVPEDFEVSENVTLFEDSDQEAEVPVIEDQTEALELLQDLVQMPDAASLEALGQSLLDAEFALDFPGASDDHESPPWPFLP